MLTRSITETSPLSQALSLDLNGIPSVECAPLFEAEHQRIILTLQGQPIAAVVPLDDLLRLQAMDQRRQEQEAAARRGERWEPWEDRLLLSDDDDEQIVAATGRTLHSIRERRRWFKRFASSTEACPQS